MESSATPIGTKKNERSGHHKAWKAIFVNRKISLIGIGLAFTLLIIAKIVSNFLYLQSGYIKFPSSNLAMAENKAQDDPVNGAVQSSSEPPLAMLRIKELELKEKETLLKRREEELLPLKEEIDEKLSQLNAIQARLTSFAQELADKEKALKDVKIGHLVALYSAMEPAKAAAIMDKLKIETVVRILSSMKVKSAGQILGMMKPERGATISEKLSQTD